MTLVLVLSAALAVGGPADAAAGANNAPAAVPVETQIAQPAPVMVPLVLPKGTLVRLMVTKEINSRDSAAGTRFPLRVDEEIKVDGVTIVPVGGKAWGEVISSEGTGGVGKGGRLNARLLYVEAMGQQVPLDGNRESKGGSSTGQVVAGLLAFGLPGLLMKGNNATLKAGEIFNGYTTADAAFARNASTSP